MDPVREQLRRLARAGRMTEVSLWAQDEAGRPDCLASVRGTPSEGLRRAAREAVRGHDTAAGPRRTVVAAGIAGEGEDRVALAARVPPGAAASALTLFAEAGRGLAGLLDRKELLETKDRQLSVLAAAERRLTRFGLDLHDGPAQAAAALLSDLRLFKHQVGEELAAHPLGEVLAGRVLDLEGRAADLEAQIRELARTAGGPAVIEGSLVPALRGEARAFAEVTGIAPKLDISGPVDQATASQRITLLRAVQEALRNAREHSKPNAVSVTVNAPPGRLEATVEDDGQGFDVDRVKRQARRRGRLGLGGIQERAKLLGGSCEIQSRPGGPTVVTILLPRWKPDVSGSGAEWG